MTALNRYPVKYLTRFGSKLNQVWFFETKSSQVIIDYISSGRQFDKIQLKFDKTLYERSITQHTCGVKIAVSHPVNLLSTGRGLSCWSKQIALVSSI